MKNNQKEIETKSAEKTNTEETANLEAAEPDVQLKVAALEERLSVYEEKIDTIVSYLEMLNEEKRNAEIEKVVTDTNDTSEINSEAEENDMESITEKVLSTARKELYNELLPLVECAKKYKDREERDKVIKMMILTEEMADAEEKADEMDEIIEKYPALKNSEDAMEKYVTAYVILKGRDACSEGKKPSIENLIEAFENDDEFKKTVIMKMREDLKTQSGLPTMNFDGGITALNIEEKPKNMLDAKNATFRLFK